MARNMYCLPPSEVARSRLCDDPGGAYEGPSWSLFYMLFGLSIGTPWYGLSASSLRVDALP